MDTRLESVNDGGDDGELVITGVPWKCKKEHVKKIMARFIQKENTTIGIKHMWCEKKSYQQEDGMIPKHDFAVLTIDYSPTLCLSEPMQHRIEDYTDCVNDYETEEETWSMVYDFNEDIKRRKLDVEYGRRCGICDKVFWSSSKPVSTFVNLNTRKVACCNQNRNQVFHFFHPDCAISWMLFCECHIIANQSGDNIASAYPLVDSVFCPSCHGSGKINPDRLFRQSWREGTLKFSVFEFKKKALDAIKEWKEIIHDGGPASLDVQLDPPSGIRFPQPPQSEATVQEKVEFIKWLPFYSALKDWE